jgi:endonuclease/exonuclease/phosphatase family metal-dependent hydrolase
MKIFILLALTTLYSQLSVLESIENLDLLLKERKRKYSDMQVEEMQRALGDKDNKLRVVSYNILFNKFDHNLDKVHRWPERKHRLMKMLRNLNADIIGIQELYPLQRDDVLSYIEDRYAFFSQPCKDGEHNGILYSKERFTLLDTHVWRLDPNESPRARTLTMVKLLDLHTNTPFAVFNTHLAFFDINMRSYEAARIETIINQYVEQHHLPIILTGDMNTYPNFPDLKKQPFFDGDFVHKKLRGKYLCDARNLSLFGHFGPLSTFSNNGEDHTPFKGLGTPGVFLDHIYVSKNIRVIVHAIDPCTINGHFPSDHLPLIADLLL